MPLRTGRKLVLSARPAMPFGEYVTEALTVLSCSVPVAACLAESPRCVDSRFPARAVCV